MAPELLLGVSVTVLGVSATVVELVVVTVVELVVATEAGGDDVKVDTKEDGEDDATFTSLEIVEDCFFRALETLVLNASFVMTIPLFSSDSTAV